LDTGANISAIRPRDLHSMGIDKSQLRGRGRLPAPSQADGNGGKLIPAGFFSATFQSGERSFMEDVVVMKGLEYPLLSRWACLGLGLVQMSTGEKAHKANQYCDINKLSDYYVHRDYLPTTNVARAPLTITQTAPPSCKVPVVDVREVARAWEVLQIKYPQPLDGICRIMKGGPCVYKVKTRFNPKVYLFYKASTHTFTTCI
jgi:hypothetical protein